MIVEERGSLYIVTEYMAKVLQSSLLLDHGLLYLGRRLETTVPFIIGSVPTSQLDSRPSLPPTTGQSSGLPPFSRTDRAGRRLFTQILTVSHPQAVLLYWISLFNYNVISLERMPETKVF